MGSSCVTSTSGTFLEIEDPISNTVPKDSNVHTPMNIQNVYMFGPVMELAPPLKLRECGHTAILNREGDYIIATYDLVEMEETLFLYSASSDTWTRWISYPEDWIQRFHFNSSRSGTCSNVVDIDRNIMYCYGDKDTICSLDLTTKEWHCQRISNESLKSGSNSDGCFYGKFSCILLIDSILYLFYTYSICIVWDPLNQTSRKVNHDIKQNGEYNLSPVDCAVYVPSEDSICMISIYDYYIQFTSWYLDDKMEDEDRFAVTAMRGSYGGDFSSYDSAFATLSAEERFIILCVQMHDSVEYLLNVFIVDRENDYQLINCIIPELHSIEHFNPVYVSKSIRRRKRMDAQTMALVFGFCRTGIVGNIPEVILDLILKWHGSGLIHELHFFMDRNGSNGTTGNHLAVSVDDIVSSVKQ